MTSALIFIAIAAPIVTIAAMMAMRTTSLAAFALGGVAMLACSTIATVIVEMAR